MGAEILDPKSYYLRRFDEVFGRDREPSSALRRTSLGRFSELGFPNIRQERWRFTNVEPLLRHNYRINSDGEKSVPLTAQSIIDASILGSLDGIRLVILDGRLTEDTGITSGRTPKGVTLLSLREAWKRNALDVQRRMGEIKFPQADNGFAALNGAMYTDGVYLHIGKGVQVETTIHIVHVSTGGPTPLASIPRTLVIAEDGSSVSVVEHFVGPHGALYLTNAVTEIFCGDNAQVNYYKIQEESPDAFHVATVSAHVGRDSRFAAHNISFGAKLARNDFNARLTGEGSEATLNGLFVIDGDRHVDNHMWMEHAAPNCQSHQLYKGVLRDRAHGVFSGRIYVDNVAQKTNAYQASRNILLSDSATIDTNPELEIYADDVRCTHGATIGQIDNDALMYLRARGIGKEDARNLLVFAFANEVTGHFASTAIADRVSAALHERLPHGAGQETPR